MMSHDHHMTCRQVLFNLLSLVGVARKGGDSARFKFVIIT